jgi:flagellar FliJ protein
MKKFRYRMENILKIKLKLEDQAKIAYAAARQRLTIEEQNLEQFAQRKVTFEDELRKLREARLNIIKIRHCQEAIEIMDMNIKQQTLVVKNAKQKLEAARVRFIDAMVERKTQDKLKEKAWEAYMHQYEQEEQKEVNELNSFRYRIPALDEEEP